eukprot:s1992_g2.t1
MGGTVGGGRIRVDLVRVSCTALKWGDNAPQPFTGPTPAFRTERVRDYGVQAGLALAARWAWKKLRKRSTTTKMSVAEMYFQLEKSASAPTAAAAPSSSMPKAAAPLPPAPPKLPTAPMPTKAPPTPQTDELKAEAAAPAAKPPAPVSTPPPATAPAAPPPTTAPIPPAAPPPAANTPPTATKTPPPAAPPPPAVPPPPPAAEPTPAESQSETSASEAPASASSSDSKKTEAKEKKGFGWLLNRSKSAQAPLLAELLQEKDSSDGEVPTVYLRAVASELCVDAPSGVFDGTEGLKVVPASVRDLVIGASSRSSTPCYSSMPAIHKLRLAASRFCFDCLA